MSTPDVPGHNPENNDELRVGAWAECAEPGDDSMIFVLAVRNDSVYYAMYDMSRDPPARYDDAMETDEFKKFFSFDPAKARGKHKAKSVAGTIKWTWHDKTPFPIERVIKKGAKPGPSFSSADDLLSAAERVRQDLQKRGRNVFQEEVKEEEEVARAIAAEPGRPRDISGKDVGRWLAEKLSKFLGGLDDK